LKRKLLSTFEKIFAGKQNSCGGYIPPFMPAFYTSECTTFTSKAEYQVDVILDS